MSNWATHHLRRNYLSEFLFEPWKWQNSWGETELLVMYDTLDWVGVKIFYLYKYVFVDIVLFSRPLSLCGRRTALVMHCKSPCYYVIHNRQISKNIPLHISFPTDMNIN